MVLDLKGSNVGHIPSLLHFNDVFFPSKLENFQKKQNNFGIRGLTSTPLLKSEKLISQNYAVSAF